MPGAFVAALIWTGVMSVITFAAFARDKRAAERGRRRAPERRLHLYEAVGGWPGALLAMRLVRHKNAKLRYLLVTLLIAAFHLCAWGFATWWWILRR